MTKIEISPPELDEADSSELGANANANASAEDTIRAKIIHILKIYPIISHSMLQIGLGSSLPPAIWRPVLYKMISDEEVMEDHLFMASPTGRQQTYTQLRLASSNPRLAAFLAQQ